MASVRHRRAILLTLAFLAVSAGSAARPLHPSTLPAAVGALAPAAAPGVVGGAQDAHAARELEVPGAGDGAVLAPETASRVGGAQEALRVVRELAVADAGAGAVLEPATASRVGGPQEALEMRELAVSSGSGFTKKCSPPPLDVAGDNDELLRASSVSVGRRALGSAAPVPPPPNSFPPGYSEHAPDDLALHPTIAEGDDGARARLAPGLIAGIVCAVVAAVVVGALAVCCYCARKRKAAAGEQGLGSPASPRWVSIDDLVRQV